MKAKGAKLTAGCLIAAVLLIVGCGDDDPRYRPTSPGDQTLKFKNLQNKDDVLHNLALAYNQRDIEEFEKLLDDDFIFIFSETDHNSGETPQQWARIDEINANQQIFDPNLDSGKRVLSIELSLDCPADNWKTLPPSPDHPGESWYTKTVDYFLVVNTADDWEHRAIGLQAQFTIRQDDSTGRWQVILWRDDVGSQTVLSPGRTAVEETTWGGIKAQYD
jgi:hypothetical protein